MAWCCAAFGPDDSYLFNSPSKWSYSCLPEGVMKLMTEEPKAKDIVEIALGPNGSYLCVYKNQQGGLRLLRFGLPEILNKWLVPIPGKGVSAKRDLQSLNVTLGPNGSFFAFDKNGSYWSNLPAGFKTAIEGIRDAKGNFKSGSYPQSVTLGADGTYVMTTVGGGGLWNLCGTNDTLNKFLNDSKSLKGLCVILSPHRTGLYLVIFNTGGCAGTIPTTANDAYEAFAADWKLSCQRLNQQPAARSANVRQSASIGKSVVKGLGLLNQILNAANGNGGGGGGGQTFNSNSGYVDNSMDMSSFWAPINSAASDPIQ